MTEIQIQRQVIKYLRFRRDLVFWRGHPSGPGYRRLVENLGLPDLCVVDRTGRFVGLEVKTVSGRLSKEQEAFAVRLRKLGAAYFRVCSAEDVERALPP